MLLWFRCKNSYSYADEAYLLMTASKQRDNEHFVDNPAGTDLRVLNVASIYGANASGKSNILRSFVDMSENIIKPLTATSDLKVTPFILNSGMEDEPTEHEVSLVIEGVEYLYGYSATAEGIKAEWLASRKSKNGEFKPLFERELNEITPYFKKTDVNSLARIMMSLADEKTLFLSLLAKRGVIVCKDIINWFRYSIFINKFTGKSSVELSREIFVDFYNDRNVWLFGLTFKELFLELMRRFDPCVTDVEIEEETDANNKLKHRIFLLHKTSTDKPRRIILEQVSTGTIQLVTLAPLIFSALQNGCLLVADEFEQNLHPLILRSLIMFFRDKEKWNKSNAQFIFTTHNIVCLTKQDMRRDEIWFTEKNDLGRSKIYPLSSVQYNDALVRADMDFGKNYLSGTFGAVPDEIDDVVLRWANAKKLHR